MSYLRSTRLCFLLLLGSILRIFFFILLLGDMLEAVTCDVPKLNGVRVSEIHVSHIQIFLRMITER